METLTTIEQRYTEVRQRVADAAAKGGRRASDVLIVSVTKFADQEQVRTLYNLGHRDFGENKVQQLIQRTAMLEEYLTRRRVLAHTPRAESPLLPVAGGGGKGPDPVRWHMIGHLQRNKARKAVELCRLIHSVDSLRLAEEIQQVAARREEPVDVLVQVNCSGEKSKFGCPMPACQHLVEQIGTMITVRVRGLMTMAELAEDPEQARVAFARCRELFEEVRTSGIAGERFNILSMGMSNDYEVALAEGANVVRIGTAIFGPPARTEEDAED
jgi:pyridoxal phosphate enzyme (YggS family)